MPRNLMTRIAMCVLGVAAAGVALPAGHLPGVSAGAAARLAARPSAAVSAAGPVAGAPDAPGSPDAPDAPGSPDAPDAPGARLWVSRIPGSNTIPALAASKDGGRVFVAGTTSNTTSVSFITAAFSGGTGKRLWMKLYHGPGKGGYRATSVTVSPDGLRVFVTGYALGGIGYATVAYSAASGARLWSRLYGLPGAGDTEAKDIAVSPGGLRVFVTGFHYAERTGDVYSTVAYNAATGARLWARQYSGPGTNQDRAFSVAASPDGRRVFVTGGSIGPADPGLSHSYRTVAYSAGTGTQLWARQDSGPDPESGLEAHMVTVSPDSRQVFISGSDGGSYVTVARNARTGKRLWAAWYGPARSVEARAAGLAVSPDGRLVFVAGASDAAFVTIGYDALTGRQVWAARYGTDSEEWGIALSPDGRKVFVTGGKYTTVGYNAITGKRLWIGRDNPPGWSFAIAAAGHLVFVLGMDSGPGAGSGAGYVTIAYRG